MWTDGRVGRAAPQGGAARQSQVPLTGASPLPSGAPMPVPPRLRRLCAVPLAMAALSALLALAPAAQAADGHAPAQRDDPGRDRRARRPHAGAGTSRPGRRAARAGPSRGAGPRDLGVAGAGAARPPARRPHRVRLPSLPRDSNWRSSAAHAGKRNHERGAAVGHAASCAIGGPIGARDASHRRYAWWYERSDCRPSGR